MVGGIRRLPGHKTHTHTHTHTDTRRELDQLSCALFRPRLLTDGNSRKGLEGLLSSEVRKALGQLAGEKQVLVLTFSTFNKQGSGSGLPASHSHLSGEPGGGGGLEQQPALPAEDTN